LAANNRLGRATAKTPETPEPSELFRALRKEAEEPNETSASASDADGWLKKFEKENLDLKNINRGNDFFIEQLQKERTGIFDQILNATRKMGELEAELRQLSAPTENLNKPKG
jgi:predicted RNase H-like nuclease (RuvC/YqgF family)